MGCLSRCLEFSTLFFFIAGTVGYCISLRDIAFDLCNNDEDDDNIGSGNNTEYQVVNVWKVLERDPDIPIFAVLGSLLVTAFWLSSMYCFPVRTVAMLAFTAVFGMIGSGVYLIVQRTVLLPEMRLVGGVIIFIAVMLLLFLSFKHKSIQLAAKHIQDGMHSMVACRVEIICSTLILQAVFLAVLTSYWYSLASFGTHAIHCYTSDVRRWWAILYTLFFLGWVIAVIKLTKLVLVVYFIDRARAGKSLREILSSSSADTYIPVNGLGDLSAGARTFCGELAMASGAITLGALITAILEEAARRAIASAVVRRDNKLFSFRVMMDFVWSFPSVALYTCATAFSVGVEVMSRYTLLIVALNPGKISFCRAGGIIRGLVANRKFSLTEALVNDMVPFAVTSGFTYILALLVGMASWGMFDARSGWITLETLSHAAPPLKNPFFAMAFITLYALLLRFSTITVLLVIILNDIFSEIFTAPSIHAPLASLLIACACKICMDFLTSAVIYATEYIYVYKSLTETGIKAVLAY